MKKNDRYVFPALLTYEDGYEIAVTFPDLPGCATSGATEKEAVLSAKEALGLHLWGMECDGDEIPQPSSVKDLKPTLEDNECVILIDVFMPAIRTSQENKAVNRTVTLPAWLNARALENNVNFSLILQEALKEKLQITK